MLYVTLGNWISDHFRLMNVLVDGIFVDRASVRCLLFSGSAAVCVLEFYDPFVDFLVSVGGFLAFLNYDFLYCSYSEVNYYSPL